MERHRHQRQRRDQPHHPVDVGPGVQLLQLLQHRLQGAARSLPRPAAEALALEADAEGRLDHLVEEAEHGPHPILPAPAAAAAAVFVVGVKAHRAPSPTGPRPGGTAPAGAPARTWPRAPAAAGIRSAAAAPAPPRGGPHRTAAPPHEPDGDDMPPRNCSSVARRRTRSPRPAPRRAGDDRRRQTSRSSRAPFGGADTSPDANVVGSPSKGLPCGLSRPSGRRAERAPRTGDAVDPDGDLRLAEGAGHRRPIRRPVHRRPPASKAVDRARAARPLPKGRTTFTVPLRERVETLERRRAAVSASAVSADRRTPLSLAPQADCRQPPDRRADVPPASQVALERPCSPPSGPYSRPGYPAPDSSGPQLASLVDVPNNIKGADCPRKTSLAGPTRRFVR